MAVPGISPHLLAAVFISNTVQAQGIAPAKHTDDLFILTMATYLNTLHSMVMQSWQQFSEATEVLSEQNAHAHRVQEANHRRQEASRLAGQERQIEALHDSPTEAVHETDKFRFHQGMHTGDSDRHLNLPV